MPDTLMLAFERPSDGMLKWMRVIDAGQQAPSDFSFDDFDKCVNAELVGIHQSPVAVHWAYLTNLGRLVLAACSPDAPDPVGKVVEAARKCSEDFLLKAYKKTYSNGIYFRQRGHPRMGELADEAHHLIESALDLLTKTVDAMDAELDRATGKAGGKL